MEAILLYLIQNPLYLLLFVAGIVAMVMLIITKKSEKPAISNSGKKREIEDEGVTIQEKTANEMVNVADIEENFLYTKDGYIISFIHLGNINIELLSSEELDIITQRLAMSFEGDRENFDYITIQSQVNLDQNKDFFKKLHQETEDLGKRKGINLMLQEMTRLSTSGENFEHQHYIKIWKKIGSNIKDTQNELRVRLAEFCERYEQAGVSCSILGEKEIIKLCSLFGNPQQAPFLGSSVLKYENIAILKNTK